MKSNDSLKSGGNSGDGSRKQKGPRVQKRGPGVAELERMMRQERVKGNSDLMDGNQFSATLQNSLISSSNFQVLPPSINNPHGFNCTGQSYW